MMLANLCRAAPGVRLSALATAATLRPAMTAAVYGDSWAASRGTAARPWARQCASEAAAEEAKPQKAAKKEKKKKEKKKKKPAAEESVADKKKDGAKTTKQVMTFEEHKSVTTDYIAAKIKEKMEERASESWLRRWTRKAMLMAYAKEGGVAHEYMREHGLTDVETHKYEMLRVLHTYEPLAHEACGNKPPRFMTNDEWVSTKMNTLMRMMASQQFYEVFPDVLDKFTPTVNLQVEYDTKEAGVVPVIFGNEVPPFIARATPNVRFEGKAGHTYTLLMVDPDAPARMQPNLGPFLHWLVGNVPATGTIGEGTEVAAYLGPGPPKGTDYHRYVYILLDEGTAPADYSAASKVAADTLDGRPKFGTREFISKHGLRPVGMSFFSADYDHYVPELYRAMGLDEPIFVDERTARVLARKDTKYESGRFRSWKVLEKEE